jgi:hypothetical protein
MEQPAIKGRNATTMFHSICELDKPCRQSLPIGHARGPTQHAISASQPRILRHHTNAAWHLDSACCVGSPIWLINLPFTIHAPLRLQSIPFTWNAGVQLDPTQFGEDAVGERPHVLRRVKHTLVRLIHLGRA